MDSCLLFKPDLNKKNHRPRTKQYGPINWNWSSGYRMYVMNSLSCFASKRHNQPRALVWTEFSAELNECMYRLTFRSSSTWDAGYSDVRIALNVTLKTPFSLFTRSSSLGGEVRSWAVLQDNFQVVNCCKIKIAFVYFAL